MDRFANQSEEACLEHIEMCERFMFRYLELQRRFADLPAAEELAMNQLQKEFSADFLDSLLDDESEETERFGNNEDDLAEGGFDGEIPPEMKNDPEMKAVNRVYMELNRIGRELIGVAEQMMSNWAAVHSMLIPENLRSVSLNLLINHARCLGALSSSFEAMASHSGNLSVVMARRAQKRWQLLENDFKSFMADWKAGKELLEARSSEMARIENMLGDFVKLTLEVRKIEDGFEG